VSRGQLSLRDNEDAARQAARAAGLLPTGQTSAQVLKKDWKSLVVRLMSQSRTSFVAKRSEPAVAALEALVYAEVLPRLPVRHLELLGRWEDGERGSWLFLEDAGDTMCAKHSPAARWAVGRLLGRIAAATAACSLPEGLPQQAADYYLQVLVRARQRLAAVGVAEPVVVAALGRLEQVEQRWDELTAIAATSPVILCHSDVIVRNLRFVAGAGGSEPVLLDWELAAQGPAVVDLGCQAVSGEADLLVAGYRVGVGRIARSTDEVLRWARVGRVFRLLHGIDWAGDYLGTSAADRGLGRLACYCRQLDRALDEIDSACGAADDG
jgi:aminoglycoside phosphotransferase (APT) family kinase protein